jgi:predicted enzyme related to lactoylglutathione lyase
VSSPLVHLELHTPNLGAARDFLRGVVGWRSREVATRTSPYVSVDLGLSGGIVACGTPTAMWLPYVEVDDVDEATDRARAHGACTVLAPRSGPQGRRSVVRSPSAGDLAFWEPA